MASSGSEFQNPSETQHPCALYKVDILFLSSDVYTWAMQNLSRTLLGNIQNCFLFLCVGSA